MLKLTLIARLNDALPLVASMEDDKDSSLAQYNSQRKQILKELSMQRRDHRNHYQHHSYSTPQHNHHHHHPQQQHPQHAHVSLAVSSPSAFTPTGSSGGPSSSHHASSGIAAGGGGVGGDIERMIYESGPYNFHILIDHSIGVCYMVLCEREYSAQLAHGYLEELRKEFTQLHGREVDSVERPYFFMRFDTFIQKSLRLYSDTRTKRNIQKLKEELDDVQQIVRRNIEDVVGRREKLSSMMSMSQDLLAGTHDLKVGATKLNRMYFWRTYGPVVVVLGIVILMLMIRYWLF